MTRFRIAGLAALVSVASVGCSGGERAADDTRSIDAEVAQELRNGAPRYDLNTTAILGEYTSSEGCPGGFAACDRISLEEDGDHVMVRFGDPGDRTYETRPWSSHGVVLFAVDGLDGDCDDPGCGNLVRITGVIYPVKNGNRYVPQIKATYVADFPFPEDEDSPSGELKTVVRLKKRGR